MSTIPTPEVALEALREAYRAARRAKLAWDAANRAASDAATTNDVQAMAVTRAEKTLLLALSEAAQNEPVKTDAALAQPAQKEG